MKKTNMAKAVCLALGTGTFALAGPAFAQDWMSQDFIKPYDETVTIGLGGIVNQFDTSLRLDGSGNNTSHGTDINLENNGLKKNLSSFEGALSWRFAQRHRLDLDYYTVSRSGSKSYTGDINIGGNDYPVGANVNIRNKYDLGSIDYAKARALEYATEAKMHLESLPPSKERDLLRELVDFSVGREK